MPLTKHEQDPFGLPPADPSGSRLSLDDDAAADEVRAGVRRYILRLLLPRDPRAPPRRERITALVIALHGRLPHVGAAEEVTAALRVALGNGITHEAWAVAMRSCVVLHSLLWEAPAAFADAMRSMVPPPSSQVIAPFADSAATCQLGAMQRPVVVFIASMLGLLLDVSSVVPLSEVIAIADGRPMTPSEEAELLPRCIPLLTYLTFLASAADLPLIAFSDALAVTVLERAVLDAKRVFVCLLQLVHHQHASSSSTHRDAAVWPSLCRQFDRTRSRLVTLFERLRETTITFDEPVPDSLPTLPREFTAMPRGLSSAARSDSSASEPLSSSTSGSQQQQHHTPTRPVAVPPHGAARTLDSTDFAAGSCPASSSLTLSVPFTHVPLPLPTGLVPTVFSDDSTPRSSNDSHPQHGRSGDNTPANVLSASLEESQAAEQYVIGDVIGEGAFGTVYRAFDNEQGHFVAIKELAVRGASPQDVARCVRDLQAEFDILAHTRHPNVVSVFGTIDAEGSRPRIVMEWMPGGSIQSALRLTRRGFRESVTARYVRQALAGLAHLHANGIVHRDVKPANMLLSASGEVKLSDFGTSRVVAGMRDSVQTGCVVGTIPYLAPECFKGTYARASDIWALGCAVLEMLTGRMPWAERGVSNTLALIFVIGNALPPQHHPQLPDVCASSAASPATAGSDSGLGCGRGTVSPAARDFLERCFAYDHRERPTAAQLLEHPFLHQHHQPPQPPR